MGKASSEVGSPHIDCGRHNPSIQQERYLIIEQKRKETKREKKGDDRNGG
jgi:hypothetical protein